MIFKYDKDKGIDAYNVLVQGLYPNKKVNTPFGTAYVTVESGKSTKPHRHHEDETFIFLKGDACVEIDGIKYNVKQSEIIFIPAFSEHTVINNNYTDVIFLTFYWNPIKHKLYPDKHIVMTPPPTPNGDLHLGHMSGPFVAGDILKRYYKLNGEDVYHITGSDDYQSYVQLKSIQTNKSPQETCKQFSDSIMKTFEDYDIGIDFYLKTSNNEKHKENVNKLLKKLYDKNVLIEKEEKAIYDTVEKKYIYEAFVGGICPYCNESTDGNICEKCGMPNNCINLLDYYSKLNINNKLEEVITEKTLYFPLNNYKNELKKFYQSVTMTDHLREFCNQILSKDLPDVPVTFLSSWGIDVNIPKFNNQKINVWFEMAEHYNSSIENLNINVNEVNTEKTILLGFDNSFFYAVLIPAIHLSLNNNVKYVDHYITNEFLNLEHQKFSTSRNHAIWAKDIIDEYSPDLIRFYLSYIRPENRISNFARSEFLIAVEYYNQFIDELIKYFNTKKDIKEIRLNDYDKNILKELQESIQTIEESYKPSNFSPKKITHEIVNTHEIIRKYINTNEQTHVGIIYYYNLISIIYPIMPELSTKLSEVYGVIPFSNKSEVKFPEILPIDLNKLNEHFR